jgi:hypothetical protein
MLQHASACFSINGFNEKGRGPCRCQANLDMCDQTLDTGEVVATAEAGSLSPATSTGATSATAPVANFSVGLGSEPALARTPPPPASSLTAAVEVQSVQQTQPSPQPAAPARGRRRGMRVPSRQARLQNRDRTSAQTASAQTNVHIIAKAGD